MDQYVVGIDLGGTNVSVLLLDGLGRVSSIIKEKTFSQEGPSGVIGQIESLVCTLIKQGDIALNQVKGIGLGLPGVIDSDNGMALFLPNLPGWRNIPVASIFRNSLDLEVYCENDVRMAAWGEKLLGVGKEFTDLICLTLGTGIGSGIFLQDKLWRGYLGSGGEVGHLTMENNGPLCSCGNRGCLEMYASGRGIARRAALAVCGKESSYINELVKGQQENITAATVHEAALAGDPLSLELIQETAEYLGIGLANLANILNPQLFVLGGGVVGGWGEMLLEPVREVVNRRAMSLNRQVLIKQAQLGEQAGVRGAAHIASLKFIKGQNIRLMYW